MLVAGCQYWTHGLLEQPIECHWKTMTWNPFFYKTTLNFWKSFDAQALLLQQLSGLHLIHVIKDMYESHFLLWKNVKTRWGVSWILGHDSSITQDYQQRMKYMQCSQNCKEDEDHCGCRSGWHSRELHTLDPACSDAWGIQLTCFRIPWCLVTKISRASLKI